jgi:hypothetical protein
MLDVRSAMRGRGGWFAMTLVASSAFAQDFTPLSDSAFEHVASGWVFPKQVGEFVRRDDPRVVDGLQDAYAAYDRTANGLSTYVTVYVYPADSPVADAPLEGARQAIAENLAKSGGLAQVFSEGPFRVGASPELIGEKTFYKIGMGPDSSQTNLYYFDLGKWVVKVRITVQKTEKDTFRLVDAFVRGLPWDELGVSPETCNGDACRLTRPIPVHGLLPEQLALLLVGQKIDPVFPAKPPGCDAEAIAAALAVPAEEGATIRLAASCALKKGIRASFLRVDLAQDMLQTFERDSPDGLSLRGPITFVARGDGKRSTYALMTDGPLDAQAVGQMLETLGGSGPVPFAKADKNGKNPQLEMRLVDRR